MAKRKKKARRKRITGSPVEAERLTKGKTRVTGASSMRPRRTAKKGGRNKVCALDRVPGVVLDIANGRD